jgi:hypothetical protein
MRSHQRNMMDARGGLFFRAFASFFEESGALPDTYF